MAFVFQSYNLLPKTTAVENVELPLMYNSAVSASERRHRAIESLQAVGLGDRLEHKSNQMSGGQMQRVAIARALVNNPAVILADEATGNLDSRTSFEILVLFQKLHAEGRTIIFVTHNPELSQYSSRNIRLRDRSGYRRYNPIRKFCLLPKRWPHCRKTTRINNYSMCRYTNVPIGCTINKLGEYTFRKLPH